MKLYHLISGPLRVNVYVLVNDKNQAVVIDCGENYKKLKQAEEQYGFKIKALILTHAHFDHSGCAKKLQDDGVKVYISTLDAPKLLNDGNLSSHFGRQFEHLTADETVMDGDVIDECGMQFKVISTPGHTDGSICLLIDNMLFSGDTLFLECVGRTDFPTGSRNEMVASVKKLFALEGDYSVYPGHEDFTTLSHERKFNLFADYD